jgi:hypothetical protein
VSVCRQGFTLTQDISWGLLLCSAFPTQRTVAQSHNVKVSSEVLCPVRRPISTLDCVLLKESSLVLAAIRRPQINPRACLWVPVRSCHSVMCCLSNRHSIFFFILCLETPRAGYGPTKCWTEPPPPPCEVIGNFMSTYSRMSYDPTESQTVTGGDKMGHAKGTNLKSTSEDCDGNRTLNSIVLKV